MLYRYTPTRKLLPVNEFLALQVGHGAAELVAVEHQLHVAKATVIAMKKLAQLQYNAHNSYRPRWSRQGTAVGRVRPSVSTLTFEPSDH